MDILWTLCVILFCTIWLQHIVRRRRDPPGPLGVPTFGILLYYVYLAVTSKLHRLRFFLSKSGKTHGDVWSFEIGQQKIVVLHSYQAIRKAMFESGEIFSGRANTEFFKLLTHNIGILNGQGNLCKIHRRFVISKLKTFGLGKQSLEPKIIAECEFIKDLISKDIGRPVNTTAIFVRGIANVISVLVFGKRWAYDDINFLDYVGYVETIMGANGIMLMFPIFFPILAKPWIIKKIPACAHLISETQKLRDVISQEYLEHKLKFNPSDEPTDLIESFLVKTHEEETSTGNASEFDDNSCIGDCIDLFIAGMDTITITLRWAMVMLAVYPEVQRKLCKEMDDSIGRNRTPQMTDRKLMPYCQATLDEIARFCTVLPHAFMKRVMENTNFMGYTIPTTAMVLLDIYSIHRSEEFWDNPNEFNPNRFLDDKGGYKPSDYLIPFGLGKRNCIGQGLAQMENFLILTSIIHRFSVSLDNESMTRLDEIMAGTDGTVNSPGRHKIIFHERD